MNKIWVIAGPTATGKTKTAVQVALDTNTDIISMDSMQIYRQMTIGTAKPTPEEMRGIRHDLVGTVDLRDNGYTVARYRQDAEACMQRIFSEGKTPLFVGGTGLYLNSILYPMQYASASESPETRLKWQLFLEKEGKGALFAELEKADPLSARRLHPNDTRRVIRALEVWEATGKSISAQRDAEKQRLYDARIVILTMPREHLYQRINERVDRMIQSGLIEEVKELSQQGFDEQTRGMQGIGYKEVVRFLKGEYSLAEMTETIKQESRRYAKRQMTWFRQFGDALFLDVESMDFSVLCQTIEQHIEKELQPV